MDNNGTEPHINCRRRPSAVPVDFYLLMCLMPPASFVMAWNRRTGRLFEASGVHPFVWTPVDHGTYRIRTKPDFPKRMEIQKVSMNWVRSRLDDETVVMLPG